jgi:hypothetical protein
MLEIVHGATPGGERHEEFHLGVERIPGNLGTRPHHSARWLLIPDDSTEDPHDVWIVSDENHNLAPNKMIFFPHGAEEMHYAKWWRDPHSKFVLKGDSQFPHDYFIETHENHHNTGTKSLCVVRQGHVILTEMTGHHKCKFQFRAGDGRNILFPPEICVNPTIITAHYERCDNRCGDHMLDRASAASDLSRGGEL